MATRRTEALPLFRQADAPRRMPVAAPAPPPDDGLLPTWTFPRLSLAFIGVALFLLVIHSYRLNVGQVAIVLGLFGVLLQRGRVRFPPGFLWCTLFFVWAAFSSAISNVPTQTSELNGATYSYSWTPLEDFAKVMVITFVVTNALRERSQVSGFFIFWLACFALWPVRGTLMNAASGTGIFGRYAWNFIFENPNDLAAMILLMLGLTLAASQAGGKQIRILAYIGTGLLTLIIFLTQSRGAFLGLMLGSAFAISVRKKRLRGLLGAGALAALVLVAAPESVWKRIGGMKALTSTDTISEADGEKSAETRYGIWGIATRIIADHPLTGVGYGGYALTHWAYAKATPGVKPRVVGRKDTHSTYLNVLAETGIVGFIGLMGTLIGFGAFLTRSIRRLRATSPERAEQFKYMLAAWIAFWTAGIFGTIHRIVFPYLFMAFATALAAQYGVLGKAPAEAQPSAPATPRRWVPGRLHRQPGGASPARERAS